jgi:hypothetical protein
MSDGREKLRKDELAARVEGDDDSVISEEPLTEKKKDEALEDVEKGVEEGEDQAMAEAAEEE